MNNLHFSPFTTFLIALVTVTIIARLFGFLFKKIGQPLVMGEVVGGIFLGPSFVGSFFPTFSSIVFPTSVMPSINIIAQLGIILYMFVIGLELDLESMKKSFKSTLFISNVSIIVPFVFGFILAKYLYPMMSLNNVSSLNFGLFIGVSMSITAFPVLARILSDKKLNQTSIGVLALACAAIDDVTAWGLLAFIVSRVKGESSGVTHIYILSILYILFLFFVIKPFMKKRLEKFKTEEQVSQSTIAILLIGAIVSAMLTEVIGIHSIFGAFIFGVIVDSKNVVAVYIEKKLKDLVHILFLPSFFAYTGMKTQLGLLNNLNSWLICILIIFIATICKFGGTLLAARILKKPWRESMMLGILMNTRGLVELIVLNIGFELKIISEELFTMLVIMAVVTTLMTGPLLQLIERKPSISQ